MKKNKLFKRENNQSTNQISITMRDSRIAARNLTKINLPLGICQGFRAQITEHLFFHSTPLRSIF